MDLIKDLDLRRKKVIELMRQSGAQACLITSNANLYYLTGKIILGYLLLISDGTTFIFIRRPKGISEENVIYIRKPEEIPDRLKAAGVLLPQNLMLEKGDITASEYERLSAVFPNAKTGDASPIFMQARAIKTAFEQDLLRKSGKRHAKLYENIPALYKKGMTDLEFSVEIERASRLDGHLGLLRTAGFKMEPFMGSLLAGDNALWASPYDFALGGKGLHASAPCGVTGQKIEQGTTVMVDISGNYFGYITDLTRTYRVGEIPDLAYEAHDLSIEIQKELAKKCTPGMLCRDLYNLALELVRQKGLEQYFMGYNQKAGFIGHGVGIQLNELPVISPKSKGRIEKGMVLALEPKFAIPKVGAVGTENTYIVTEQGLECITPVDENIIELK